MLSLRTSAVLAFLSYVLPIAAGPGAGVYACINLISDPTSSYTVTFNPASGANRCMTPVGNTVTVDVTRGGLTCASLGYVEAKSSSSGGDTCATDESIWNIAYNENGKPNPSSGSIRTRWRRSGLTSNEISFKESVPGAAVCGSQAVCAATVFNWRVGSQGPVYFIFTPSKQTYAQGSRRRACG
ncbi:hypothetical protein F5B18DRAFT_611574 [Nemania serpens]|nr:hypothetical protein F5B18DRAFT_611574 [Nemania serpens]